MSGALLACLLSGLALLGPSDGEAQDTPVVPPVVPHEVHVLDNGLTVILAPDDATPRVEVNVWYAVGAADDPPGTSGGAHLVEHLMMEGAEPAAGMVYDATTNHDRTNFFSSGPSHLLQTMLWVEANRMASMAEPGSATTPEVLERVREVVREERRQRVESRPYGRADERVRSLLYPLGHPYRESVLGRDEHLQSARLDDILETFAPFYRPNNASLAVVGDFDPETTLAWIEELFGDLPPGSVRAEALEGSRAMLERPVALTLYDDVSLPRISFVYHSAPIFQPGDAEADVMAEILAAPRTGRLVRRLVEQDGLAVSVKARQMSARLGSLFELDVHAAEDADLDALVAAMDEELARVWQEGLDEGEVAGAVARLQTARASGLQRLHPRAEALNRYQLHTGRSDGFAMDHARYSNLTADVVGHFGQWILRRPRLTLTVLPESRQSAGGARDRRPEPSPPAPLQPVEPDTETTRDSGLTIWTHDRAGLPLVTLRLVLPWGQVHEAPGQEGVGALTAGLMLAGAGGREGEAFATALDGLGARLSIDVGVRHTVLSLTVLRRHRAAALELLGDALWRPRFDPEDVSRARRLQIASLVRMLDNPRVVAELVADAVWFGPDHRYGIPGRGTPETVATLDRDAVVACHAAMAGLAGAVLMLAGDLGPDDGEAVAEALERQAVAASAAEARSVAEPVPRPPRLVVVDRPGTAQTVMRLVLPAKPGHGPSWTSGELVNDVLGGSFPSRLNLNLRMDKGYTDGAWSSIRRWPEQAQMVVWTSVRTPVSGAALGECLAELARLKSGDIEEPEAAAARSVRAAAMLAQDETAGTVLDAWLELWREGALPLVRGREAESLDGHTAALLNDYAGRTVATEAMLVVLVGDGVEIRRQLEGLDLPPIEWRDSEGRPARTPGGSGR